MESDRKFVPVQLPNGATIKVEATTVSQLKNETTAGKPGEIIEREVSSNFQYLQQVTDAIEGIADTVKKTLDKVKPTKASLEFGVEFGYESGQITAMIVKGEGKANLNITLEWDYSQSSTSTNSPQNP